MAKAITQIDKKQPNAQEEQAEAISDILKQLADNREALTNMLEIIQELQKAGVLDMIKGLLRTKEKIGSIAMEQINQPSMHHIIKNGFNAIEFIGSLDPDQMETMLSGVSHGLKETSKGKESDEKIGLWDMMKALKDPHINTSLSTMFNFLNGMGKEIEKKQAH